MDGCGLGVGWGGWGVDVSRTCTHGRRYAMDGVGGMLTVPEIAHMVVATQGMGWVGVNIASTCTWSMLRNGWDGVGGC